MKKTLPIIIKFLLMSIFAWTANASAGDIQYKIETFDDASSAIQIESIPNSKFVSSSGEIRQPYQKGNLWIRITIEKNSPDLILYFQNPSIDEISLFLKDKRKMGSWQKYEIPFKKLLHGYELKTAFSENLTQPIEFYLQINSLSPKQFNLMILSESEALSNEFKKYAILSSQFTAAVILMIWVALQNWLARSKIFLTVMIATPLFVLSRINYFGYFLDETNPHPIAYLNMNMIFFLTLIGSGTLILKESFGRLLSKRKVIIFHCFFYSP